MKKGYEEGEEEGVGRRGNGKGRDYWAEMKMDYNRKR